MAKEAKDVVNRLERVMKWAGVVGKPLSQKPSIFELLDQAMHSSGNEPTRFNHFLDLIKDFTQIDWREQRDERIEGLDLLLKGQEESQKYGVERWRYVGILHAFDGSNKDTIKVRALLAFHLYPNGEHTSIKELYDMDHDRVTACIPPEQASAEEVFRRLFNDFSSKIVECKNDEVKKKNTAEWGASDIQDVLYWRDLDKEKLQHALISDAAIKKSGKAPNPRSLSEFVGLVQTPLQPTPAHVTLHPDGPADEGISF